MNQTPEQNVETLIGALKEARAALHQHYVDWDGEPEDAVPLQRARATCDAALSAAEPLLARQDARPVAETPLAFKRSSALLFEGGLVKIRLSGFANNGSGYFAFKEPEPDDEGYCSVEVPASEFVEIRDWLNKTLPTDPDSVREERLRIAAWLHSEAVKYRSTRHISEADALYYAAIALST